MLRSVGEKTGFGSELDPTLVSDRISLKIKSIGSCSNTYQPAAATYVSCALTQCFLLTSLEVNCR